MSFDFDRVTLSDLSRDFGRRRALAHISFTCGAGEIVGLLGPNGAGKSTLLAVLATILGASAGEVRYGECTAREAGPALRRRLGLLAHDVQLYVELTARENLAFFARLYGVADDCIDRALGTAALGDRADDLVAGFSRGMRQRLALERALLHHPRLLLLDEPFTGLDQAATSALMERLRGLRTAGCIVVLATHDLDLVEGLVDKIAILRDGRLATAETAAAGSIKDQYREAMRGA